MVGGTRAGNAPVKATMPNHRALLACLLALCPLALPLGCGDRSIVSPEADAGTDAGDAGSDAGADAGRDAGSDAGVDGGSDAGSDGGSDAGTDGGIDGGSDGGSDGGTDGGCPHACGAQCVPESATSCGANCDVCSASSGYTPSCANHVCTQICDTSNHHTCPISGACAANDSTSQCGTLCLTCVTGAINGTTNCTNNKCGYTCDPGYHDCGNFLLPCKDNTSPDYCGARCSPCSAPPTTNAHATCTSATCGWECNAGYHLCGNACEAVSPNSCGATCKTCATPPDPNAVATCDNTGTCGTACKAGYHSCNGGVCVLEEKTSCGAACDLCPAPPSGATEQCLGHACTYVCTAPNLKCAGGCCAPLSVWAGGNQTCVVVAGGELRCFGELGGLDRTSVPRAETPASGPYSAAALGASPSPSASYRCGLTSAGRVVCFDGSTNGVLVASNVAQLTAGDSHQCAVTSTGGIKCAGANGYGQLGNGNTTASTTPLDVVGFTGSGAASVAAHANTTCAVTTGGAVQCWGLNGSGQVGDNSKTNRSAPVNVSGLTAGVSAVAVGDEHTCALLGGAVKCWGDNTYGQLGTGGTTDSQVPVAVAGLSSVLAISAGDSFSCALLTGGTVKCWGYNGYGQVGNNDSGAYHVYTPATVVNVSGATSLVSGYWHSCAKTSAGVWCWGWNAGGQCGNGVDLPGHSIEEYSAVQVIGR